MCHTSGSIESLMANAAASSLPAREPRAHQHTRSSTQAESHVSCPSSIHND